MQIIKQGSRRAAQSHHIVQPKTPRVSWDKDRKSVTLEVRRNPDGKSQWDNWVHLSISDLREAINCLAEKGTADCQEEISKEFSSQSNNLLKIIMCSIGLGPRKE